MKKLLALTLVLILALSALTACGGGTGGGNSDGNDTASEESDNNGNDMEQAVDLVEVVIDESEIANIDELKEILDMAVNAKWPADKLPDGVPPYPEGICIADGEPGNIVIVISGTSEEIKDQYIETLTDGGWTVTAEDEQYGTAIVVIYTAVKEECEIKFMLMGKTINMTVEWEL